MELPVEIGRVCYSRSGRDQGKYFVIIGLLDDEEYVLIADGGVRKIGKPKKKKRKHLILKPIVLELIRDKFLNGQKVFDAELKSAIINTGYVTQKEEE
ncbi:MAG: RNA-binding protein [Christensenellaceae bacterium]|jgi:ribosomal protein L14E/L6E/L27E